MAQRRSSDMTGENQQSISIAMGSPGFRNPRAYPRPLLHV